MLQVKLKLQFSDGMDRKQSSSRIAMLSVIRVRVTPLIELPALFSSFSNFAAACLLSFCPYFKQNAASEIHKERTHTQPSSALILYAKIHERLYSSLPLIKRIALGRFNTIRTRAVFI